MGIDRRDIPKGRITNNLPEPPEPRFVKGKPKPKVTVKPMLLTRIGRLLKTVVGFVIGAGGGIFAGLDPEFALIAGITAIILIFAGTEKAEWFWRMVRGDKSRSE